MSQIKRLEIRDFRLFPSLEVTFSRGVNLIHGENGAGKTTLLEAVFLAGRGKSFRHHLAKPLIREGADSLMAIVQTAEPEGVIGIELSRSDIRIRVDNQELKRRSQLLQRFPVQLLTPQSHHLVESGPKSRRIFLDFGLFHVEPTFHRLLTEFEKLLRQRNAFLSGSQERFQAFDPQFTERGERLADLRREYGARLEHRVREVLADLLPDERISFRYQTGWNANSTLKEALSEARMTDKRLGYTSVGPQRGGMEIWTEMGLASKVLSRGQQKLLVFAMVLAQAMLTTETTGQRPVLLIDDLSAELDRANRARVLALVADLPMQVIVTNTDIEPDWSDNLSQLFHVEHPGGRS